MMADAATADPADDNELLLPWRATGQLGSAAVRRIDVALSRDAGLRQAYDGIQCQRAGIVAQNKALGVPSPRALIALFAAIDRDCAGVGSFS